jgi:hypothetical protein
MVWIFGGHGPARRDRGTSALVLEEGRLATALCWFALLGAPASVAVLSTTAPLRSNALLAVWILVAGMAVTGAIGILLRERILVSPVMLRKHGPFGLRREARWHDLVAVSVERGAKVRLRYRDGRRILVEPSLVGFRDFLDEVERFAPVEVRRRAHHDLERLRRALYT